MNLHYRRHYNNLENQVINNLILISDTGKRHSGGSAIWLVKCYCGNLFETRPARIKSGVTKSCGCYQKKLASERAKNKIGPLHHNYNPNLTEEDRLGKRDFTPAKEWKKAVYKKDNYTCQICFDKPNKLNAHHLDGWHWCKEKRFDIDNGITLCIKCHKDFHSIYSNRNNTKEQFLEFIKTHRKEDVSK